LRFAVRGRAQRQASPRSHGTSCRDVSSRVHVGVVGVSAGPAAEDGLALARLRIDDPARRATLRGVGGVDLLYSARSLLFQTRRQQAPARCVDGSIESSLLADSPPRDGDGAARGARHGADVEVLNPDHVEAAGQVGGGLLHPVLAPVCFAGLQTGDLGFDPSSPIGSPAGSGQGALESPQAYGLSVSQSGYRQKFTRGQRCRNSDASVDTYDCSSAGWELRPRLRQLATLLGEARRDRPTRPPPCVLLNSQIPDVSSVSTVVQKQQLLGTRRAKPVAGHANKLSIGTDELSTEAPFCSGLITGHLGVNQLRKVKTSG
jgi:hypothetical protein